MAIAVRRFGAMRLRLLHPMGRSHDQVFAMTRHFPAKLSARSHQHHAAAALRVCCPIFIIRNIPLLFQ
jgi:hypothetical protein